MSDLKVGQLKIALKSVLKLKGIKYEQLAESLHCSLPTVKRIMGPEELSLSRLLQICEVAEIDLSDLERLAGRQDRKEENFTAEQQEFLAKNKSYFSYLMALYSGDTPQKIAAKHKLSQRSTDKYLVQLEKLDLVRVTGRLKVKPRYEDFPALGNGPLAKVYFESFIQSGARFFTELIRDAIATVKKEDRIKTKFAIQSAKISKASYEAWVERQEKALIELVGTSKFEEKTLPVDQLMTVVVVHGHTLVPNTHPSLAQLENVMGPIENL